MEGRRFSFTFLLVSQEGADQSLEGTQQPKPPRKSMTSEQKTRLDQINLRCLSLCQLMLERVNGVSVVEQSRGLAFDLKLDFRGEHYAGRYFKGVNHSLYSKKR